MEPFESQTITEVSRVIVETQKNRESTERSNERCHDRSHTSVADDDKH